MKMVLSEQEQLIRAKQRQFMLRIESIREWLAGLAWCG